MSSRVRSQLAVRVLTLMDERELTQAQLARRLGHNRAFLSDLARGKKLSINPSDLAELAAALSTTTDYLEGMSDDPTPPRASPRMLPPRPKLPVSIQVALAIDALNAPAQHDLREPEADDAEPEDDPEAHETDEVDAQRGTLDPWRLRSLVEPFLKEAASQRRQGGPRFTAPIPVYTAETGQLRVGKGLESRRMPRPAVVNAVPGAYAVRWPSASLEPRIRADELLILAPGSRLEQGQDVLAIRRAENETLSGETVTAGRFAGLRDGHVALRPFGGGADVRIALDALRGLHPITMIILRG